MDSYHLAAERLDHPQMKAGVYLWFYGNLESPVKIWRTSLDAGIAKIQVKSHCHSRKRVSGRGTLIALESVVRTTGSHRTWPIYPRVSHSVTKRWFVWGDTIDWFGLERLIFKNSPLRTPVWTACLKPGLQIWSLGKIWSSHPSTYGMQQRGQSLFQVQINTHKLEIEGMQPSGALCLQKKYMNKLMILHAARYYPPLISVRFTAYF